MSRRAYEVLVFTRGAWSAEAVGDADGNRFGSVAEARAAVRGLRRLGGEWAEARYALRDVTSGETWVLPTVTERAL